MVRKWMKEERFVEIATGISTDHDGPVFFVETNAFPEGEWPLEWRALVPDSDEEKLARMETAVRTWVEREGFEPVSLPLTGK